MSALTKDLLAKEDLEDLSPEKFRAILISDGANASDFDFSNNNFQDIDFSKLDLESCNFSGCHLEKCNFSRSNLYSANFSDSNLLNCSFVGALLTESEFSDADLVSCDFTLAELTNSDSDEASFEECDFSRSRGLSQHFLDQAVGSTNVLIPKSLDYPEHWLSNEEEFEENKLLKSLRAYRGDEVLLCSFDGRRVISEQVAERERTETKSALQFLQQKLKYAIEERLLHNESPTLFRAISDYYEVISENAGDQRSRWPKKLYELDEIRVGLEGNNLSAVLESVRAEITTYSADKIPLLDQLVQAHFMLASGLDHWRQFLNSATDARLNTPEIAQIEEFSTRMIEATKNETLFDPLIPKSLMILKRLLSKPKEIARLAAFGIVRSIESIFSALFTYIGRFGTKYLDAIVEKGALAAANSTILTLTAIGAGQIFSLFPHLSIWFEGALAVLKTLGLA